MKKILFVIIVMFLFLFSVGTNTFGGDDLNLEKLNFDGVERSYWVYLPEEYDGVEQMPLVFVFHGYTSNAMELMSYADFREEADARGMILVYPEGTLLENVTHWNVGGWTNRSTTDDVGFVGAMIDAMDEHYAVDLERVYATGHSNGGYLSIKLACEMSDRIAAVASVSGLMTPEMYSDCEPSRAMPLIEIHGLNDELVLYDGVFWSTSVEETINFWREKNGCVGDGTMEVMPTSEKTSFESSVEHYSYSNTEGVVMVEHYKVIGGGHEWLNSINVQGDANWDINTIETILNFFDRFDINGMRE
jgi:polyhydroxybutyrate depolymerase